MAEAPTPALLAKAALRRLAAAKLEPTPENYARAYAEEAGSTAAALPDGARAALSRLAAAAVEDSTQREAVISGLMQGRWDQVDALMQSVQAQSDGLAHLWSGLLPRAVDGVQRRSRNWSPGRRRESLTRVIEGSRSDLHRLAQRLQSLLTAWEGDGTVQDESLALEIGPAPEVVTPTADAVGDDAAWKAVSEELGTTVDVALPGDDARARALADRLATLSAQLGSDGATPGVVAQIADVCGEARSLLGQRHRLLAQLTELCRELGRSLVTLAEDEDWSRGLAEQLDSRLAEAPSLRSVRAATTLLGQARQRQVQLLGERQAARDALKGLMQSLLDEAGVLGQQTDRFQDALSRHVPAVRSADTPDSLAALLREIVADTAAVQEAVRRSRARMLDEQGKAQALQQRVQELERELRRISDEALTDALTQVANRRGLQAVFDAQLAQLARAGADAPPLALALIDIDNFKKLNDSLGHAAGDKALQSLAAGVRDRLRPGDHIARFGGEEFVLLLPATDADVAVEVLTRLQRSLSAALFMQDGREVFVTFSAGVTTWRPGEALEATLERADEALYEAKRTGKNRTCRA